MVENRAARIQQDFRLASGDSRKSQLAGSLGSDIRFRPPVLCKFSSL